jgi:histidine phosphotransferase ChpT
MQIDVRVLEMLASKICHDLISPVGAINNGVELVNDVGGDVVEEAMKLIGDSAAQAAKKLRLFRICYGRAGSESNLTIKDVRGIAEEYLSAGKIKLVWPAELPSENFSAQKGGLKLLLNVILLAEETLAYGGTVTIQPSSDPAHISCRIEASGRSAALQPVIVACLEGKTIAEEITPRTVHAHVTALFAGFFGFRLHHEPDSVEKVTFVLTKAH